MYGGIPLAMLVVRQFRMKDGEQSNDEKSLGASQHAAHVRSTYYCMYIHHAAADCAGTVHSKHLWDDMTAACWKWRINRGTGYS
jgi:hypothetical protein